MASPLVRRSLIFATLPLIGAAAWFGWQHVQPPPEPAGFASGNGRIEATEVDVATRTAGRLLTLTPHEGDSVSRGSIVAQMDVDELNAQLREAEAGVAQARQAIAEARAGVALAASNRQLAQANLQRTEQLIARNFLSVAQRDRDRSTLETSDAALAAAQVRVSAAEAAALAAEARADRLRSTIADSALKAPISGRVLYRLAEPGEVLAAGGKTLTLLDLDDVSMSIYLPEQRAGQVALGAQARIKLDAAGELIPATVTYIAPRAQFTPREVETRTEREKLMFRVKVRIEPAWLAQHRAEVKPGVPGIAWIRTDPQVAWPASLPAH